MFQTEKRKREFVKLEAVRDSRGNLEWKKERNKKDKEKPKKKR
jgi:hypothetical protein